MHACASTRDERDGLPEGAADREVVSGVSPAPEHPPEHPTSSATSRWHPRAIDEREAWCDIVNLFSGGQRCAATTQVDRGPAGRKAPPARGRFARAPSGGEPEPPPRP